MPAINERIYRVQAPYSGNAVQLYLVRGEKLALVDSGASDSPSAAVEPALRELGLDWSDLDYLINTHGHPDHAGGNGEVKEAAPRAEIHLHRADLSLADGVEAHLRSSSDGAVPMKLLGRDDLVAEREAVLRQVIGKSVGVDRVLEDGDVIDLGQDVRLSVVHTPGHTPGSVCFFWEASGALFCGDAVQGHGWRAGLAPLYFDTAYVNSLDRIEAVGASMLCMGHAFAWSGVLNDPVRRGPEVAETLLASRRASAAIDQVVDYAIEKHGLDAPFGMLVDTAFRELVYELPIQWDRRTGFPVMVGAAIHAHLAAKGWRAPAGS